MSNGMRKGYNQTRTAVWQETVTFTVTGEHTRMKSAHVEHWNLYDDYEVAEDHLRIAGDFRGTYNPVERTTLPSAIANIQVDDTAALQRFARIYGLFGYQDLCHPGSEEPPTDHPGEPLTWVWRHVRTLKLCLTLQKYYSGYADWQYEALFKQYRPKNKPQKHNRSEIEIGDKGGSSTVPVFHTKHANMHNVAQRLRDAVIQRNTRDLRYELQRLDGKAQPTLVFSSLIEVAYWHLSRMGNKRVKACEWCDSVFLVHHGNQRFCPPKDSSKESLCAVSARQHRQREKRRGQT